MSVPRDLSGADLRKALSVLGYEETRHGVCLSTKIRAPYEVLAESER
jgi:hypothetical protein